MGPGEGCMLLLLLTSLFQVLWDATHVDQLAMYEKEGRMGGGIRPEEVSDTKERNNNVLPPSPLPPWQCSTLEPTRSNNLSPPVTIIQFPSRNVQEGDTGRGNPLLLPPLLVVP
jgi:hypothetical protein